ncbi:MAG: nitroreductase [Parvularculaceae bacterium]
MAHAPPIPPLGEPLSPADAREEVIDALARRRSTTADLLGPPGPDAATLDVMLRLAARAPDHRRVAPFRFVVLEGDARESVGETLARAYAAANPDADAARAEKERGRFARAPVVVAVVSSVDLTHKTPEWEQILTAGAVCQNLLIAARAFGFAAQWLTEWCAYDDAVTAALGLKSDERRRERIAGYVYLGTAREDPKERARPDMNAIVERLKFTKT